MPIKAAPMDAIRTADAIISFIVFAYGWTLGSKISTILSNIEFIISKTNTRIIIIAKAAVSQTLRPKNKIKKTTTIENRI